MITNILDSITPYSNHYQATEVVKTAHFTNLLYNYNTIVGILPTYPLVVQQFAMESNSFDDLPNYAFP